MSRDERVRREERAARHGPIWARPEPGARRARFTREQIAQAALAIADAEGLEAVSMRRVAKELGAGTMTLYHYVRTKDELLALMDDAIMGELLIPGDDVPEDWREALTLIARRTRDAFVRHPWVIDVVQGVQSFGPNSMRHIEQSAAAVAGTGVDPQAKFEIMSQVDEYVFGFVLRERTHGPFDPEERERWFARAAAFVQEQLETGDFPHTRALWPHGDIREAWLELEASVSDDERFERGLARLLDGIELDIRRERVEDAPTSRRSRPAAGSRPSTRSATRRPT
jgi:AcrR family transcriptional regulator